MSQNSDSEGPTSWLYNLSAALTTVAVSTTNIFIPLFLKSLGHSYVVAGMPVVVRGIGRFSFDAASVYVMGIIRPGLVLCSGIATTALGILLCALFPFPTAVNGANFLIGGGIAAFHIAIRQIIFALGRKGEKGKAIGTLSVAIAVGPTLGILVGGLISDFVGYRILFFGCVALMGIPFTLLYPVRNTETRHRTDDKGHEWLQWGIARDILSRPGMLVLCACATFVFFYQQAISLSVAFYATDSAGLSLFAFGVLRALSQMGTVGGRYLGGHGADRLGVVPCMLAGFLISSAGFFVLPWSYRFSSLLATTAVIFFGSGLINVSSQVATMSAVPSRMRGQAIGLYRGIGDIGMFIGPLVVTLSLERIGFLGSFIWLGTVPLLFALFVLVKYPRK